MNDLDFCEVPRWQYLKSFLNNLPFEKFVEAYSSDPNGVCIDARTPEEFATGRLRSAVNINYLSADLADHLETLDLSKTYYIYCRTSRRSLRICILLKNMGATVVHLEHGIKDIMYRLGHVQKNIFIVEG